MKDSISKIYKDLPAWARGAVVIGGLAMVFFVGKSVLSKFKQEQERLKALKDLKNSKDELQSIVDNGVPASYPKSTFDGWASALVDQFAGCDFSSGGVFGVVIDYMDLSTSGKKLYDIVNKLNNNRDFLELVDSWGIRTYDACGLWGDEENKNLKEAVSNELNGGEIEFINQKLRDRSITYQF